MKITSFGEVLWDNLPSGKKLGGAPLNVLVRLRALGADCAIISSRGADADGDEIQRQIEEKECLDSAAADLPGPAHQPGGSGHQQVRCGHL